MLLKDFNLPHLKSTLILDIDRTLNLADPEIWVQKGLELGYGRWDARQWTLYEEVIFDMDAPPNPEAVKHHQQCSKSYGNIIVLSSRMDTFEWRAHTEAWLQKHKFHYDVLLMRPTDKMDLPSHVIKRELIEPHLATMNLGISTYVDDDKKCVEAFRQLGFNTFTAPDEWEKAISYRINRMPKRTISDLRLRKLQPALCP